MNKRSTIFTQECRIQFEKQYCTMSSPSLLCLAANEKILIKHLDNINLRTGGPRVPWPVQQCAAVPSCRSADRGAAAPGEWMSAEGC